MSWICKCCVPFSLLIAGWGHANGAEVDELMAQWTAIERQRAAIQANWQERERLGRGQLNLLRAEKQSLEAYLASVSESNDAIDVQRGQLLEEQSSLEAADAQLRKRLALLVDRLIVVASRLPPPLQQRWTVHLSNLNDLETALSERLTTLLALLHETAEFDARIALHSTRMTFGDREFQVQQIYLGLAHGWYISEDGAQVGSGRAAAQGWVWQDESTNTGFDRAALQRAIEQVQARGAVELVALPISLEAP
ncbi:MAG: DUF3450 family protein [Pseudomonadota bacterium]